MSTPDDKRPVTWKTVSRVADDASAADAAERDALSSMSDADLDAKLAAAGFAPGDAAKLVGAALATPARPAVPARVSGGVDPPRSPSGPSRLPIFAFAAAAVVVGLLFWKRAELIALLPPSAHEPIAPDVEGPPPGPTPGQLEQARFLRAQATGSCADQRWFDCRDELERATRLDPAGDATPEVQALRRSLADARQVSPAPTGGRLKP